MADDVLQDPRSGACLLIFEIGNSHVAVATSVGNSIRTNRRFSHDQFDAIVHHADEVWAALPDDRFRAVAAASVVPPILAELRRRLENRYEEPLLAVGDELHRPMSLAVEAPEAVGVDRVCSAAAAYDVIGRACAVASFGTAITIDCVNDEGVFMGGAILPGLNMSARALHEGTAALPEIKIEAPVEIYGTTTEQCIRTGVLYGAVGALREITERYATQLGSWPQLVVTGGNAVLIQSQCEFIDNIVPDLCIRGIALAYRRHFSPLEEAL
jgi:type III pantothenate kinase